MFLSNEEMQDLTGYKNRDAQLKALRHMGIEHKQRPDGRVLVTKEHAHNVFNGTLKREAKKAKKEPNFDAI